MMIDLYQFSQNAHTLRIQKSSREDDLEREVRRIGKEYKAFRKTARAKDRVSQVEKERSEEMARRMRARDAELEETMQGQRAMAVYLASEAVRLAKIRKGYRASLAEIGQQAQAATLAVQGLEAALAESRKREDALVRAAVRHTQDMRRAVEEESARKASALEMASRIATDDLQSKIRAQATAMRDLQNSELSWRLDEAKKTDVFKARIECLENEQRLLRIEHERVCATEQYWRDKTEKGEKTKDKMAKQNHAYRQEITALRSQLSSHAFPAQEEAEDDDIVVLEEDPRLTESKRLAASSQPKPPATQSPSLPSDSQPPLSSSQSARSKKRPRTLESFTEEELEAIAEKADHEKWYKKMICIFCE
jgi:hypothetical protein